MEVQFSMEDGLFYLTVFFCRLDSANQKGDVGMHFGEEGGYCRVSGISWGFCGKCTNRSRVVRFSASYCRYWQFAQKLSRAYLLELLPSFFFSHPPSRVRCMKLWQFSLKVWEWGLFDWLVWWQFGDRRGAAFRVGAGGWEG